MPSATSTGSLNVTDRFASTATSAALSAGVVDVTVGASSGGAAVVNPTTTSLAMASGGSFVSWSVTCDATIVRVQSSLPAKSVAGSRVKVVGPPLTVAGWVPLPAHEMSNHEPATSTGSLNVTCRFASTGDVDRAIGGRRAGDGRRRIGRDAVTEMSSTPTHSSIPGASVVMIRTSTTGWLFAAAGRVTLTGVTSVARLGPVVASATYPAGRFVYVPSMRPGTGAPPAGRRCSGSVDVAQVVGDLDVGQPGGVHGDDDARGRPRRSTLDATTGSLSSNSATPPCERPAGSVWLALTLSDASSTVTCWGRSRSRRGRPLEADTPGTPFQLLSVVMSPVFVQSWERQGLGRRVGGDGYHRKNGEQQGGDKPGDGGPMSGGWDQHGGEPPRK